MLPRVVPRIREGNYRLSSLLELAHTVNIMPEEVDTPFRAGIEFYIDAPTNQQFVILENARLARLQESVAVSFWEK